MCTSLEKEDTNVSIIVLSPLRTGAVRSAPVTSLSEALMAGYALQHSCCMHHNPLIVADKSMLFHLQPLDSVSLAGARKQESEMHWAPDSSPSASSAQSQSETAASHLASLSGLPGYTVWLEQQYGQLQAQMSAQAAASGIFPPRSHADPLSMFTPHSQGVMSGATDQEQLIYLQGIQAGLQSKSTPSAAMQAMESAARYAASDGGSPMLVPAETQSQHHVLSANVHFAPPAGGQLPSMTGHELTNRLCQSGVQYQQLDQAALHHDLTAAEQLPLGRSWPGPQATSMGEIVESE